MNRSFKNNRIAFILIFIVLAVFSCAAQTPQKQVRLQVADPVVEFKKLCDLLTPKTDSASDNIIRQWRKDVYKITDFTVEDHITVIESLQREQTELYEQFDLCDAQAKAAIRNYSSRWLADLKNKFGLDYLKKNRDEVFVCIGAMIYLQTDHYCRTTQEKLLINEDTLATAYERYCDLFNEFYDTLQKDKKSLLADQHEQVSKLLDSIKHELNDIVTHQNIMTKIFEEKAMRLNKELYLYMKNDLNMVTMFDPLKAGDDFKRLIGE